MQGAAKYCTFPEKFTAFTLVSLFFTHKPESTGPGGCRAFLLPAAGAAERTEPPEGATPAKAGNIEPGKARLPPILTGG